MLHILLGFFLTLSGFGFLQRVESLGINYGQVGNNLPPPEKVLDLLRALKLTKARIYDTNPQVLTAFANSSIELIVTVENEMLATLMDPNQALQWVYTRIRPYFPATRITGIAVGNEVFTGDDTTLITYLVPAMFLATTKAPFWINAYPYFAYKDNPDKIPLDYVLLNPNSGTVDPNTKLHYDNMLYAQVDAVTFAMAKMGYGGLEVRVSETGWPSRGDPNEIGATLENAAIYNRNILRRQLANEGTPLRPRTRLEIYVFALFNEDMKPGPTSERNYGLFQPDGTMAYNVGLSALSTATSTSSTSLPSISLTSNATQIS
ncbi:UNVERIFIED_CONTAM: Glucan endo-1,3-beta-glucosidase 11 [Sesamum radiatum]|uniref:Glucan endo-1,3-beta-glucosidase 11 n=1 Tax=Sesamum radiatum TaxID=300843 RepID=A0AAW2T050_SESRA